VPLYKKILVALDGSAAAERGLREAIRLAKADAAELLILHVANEFYAYAYIEGMGLDADKMEALRHEGRRLLDRARAAAERQGVRARSVMREIASGAAAESIVREAKKQGVGLIVLGTHGRRGLRRMVLGSDAEQVVRTATVPVLFVRAPA
jgi:nucleotide-binding universal stress UspA family protein